MVDCALVVIDDVSVLRQAGGTLRDAAYLVVCLSDAELAVELLSRVSYDVVVTDLETLSRVTGDGKVSMGLSRLLNQTRSTPVVLGRRGLGGPQDLVDLTDPKALLQRVREAIGTRQSFPSLADEEDLAVRRALIA